MPFGFFKGVYRWHIGLTRTCHISIQAISIRGLRPKCVWVGLIHYIWVPCRDLRPPSVTHPRPSVFPLINKVWDEVWGSVLERRHRHIQQRSPGRFVEHSECFGAGRFVTWGWFGGFCLTAIAYGVILRGQGYIETGRGLLLRAGNWYFRKAIVPYISLMTTFMYSSSDVRLPRSHGHDVQFGVLVSNLDQRLRPLIFDIQSHFLIEVPSHFVRASGCFSGTWWRRSNRKARPTESWLRLTIPPVDEGGCPLLLPQVRSPHSSRASESCDCCNASLFCGAWTFVCGCQCLLVEKVEPWAESYFVILLCTQNV